MDEYEEYINQEFFIIDSNNLNDIKPTFYGYSIQNGKIVTEENINQFDELDGNGAFIWIKCFDEEIEIIQDFNGSYGLYYYKNKNYFAFSNSFYKLVEFLKEKKYTISFNQDFANAFLFKDLCSYSYNETLCNEIIILPRNDKIKINKNTNNVTFKKIDYEEFSISINSKEGIECLDNWFYNWINIIRKIRIKTNNISFDLSGGFDTRMLATLWLNANIDLNKINISSSDYDGHVFKQDYEIASKIANTFNFKLNQPLFLNKLHFDNFRTPFYFSFYLKFGFHKEMYYDSFKYEEPLYCFRGSGGECVRGYPNETFEEYYQHSINHATTNLFYLEKSATKILDNTIELINQRVNLNSKQDIPRIAYNEIRTRNHYGKSLVEYNFTNKFTLTPLIDLHLRKLKLNTNECDDEQLLMALIFIRYCPKLLDFEVEGNRSINKETIEYAKKINNKYPLKKIYLENISGPEIKKTNKELIIPKFYVELKEVDDLVKNIFCSEMFKKEFSDIFPIYFYYLILKSMHEKNYFPLTHLYSAIAIVKIKNECDNLKSKNLNDWINSFIMNKKNENVLNEMTICQLLKYTTARIDIINRGNYQNNLQIISSSDDGLMASSINWINKDIGNGIFFESAKSCLDLEIKCIKDGKLEIALKGMNVLDKFNERFPIYIDFISFRINGEEFIDKRKLVSHDTPYFITKRVKDSEILKIHTEWDIFSKDSEYKNESVTIQNENKKLKSDIHKLNTENKKLKSDNHKLNTKNKKLKENVNKYQSRKAVRIIDKLKKYSKKINKKI